ncbi:receptor-type guanylate cyclase Gyc76C isoform X1 [Tribolium castaneum]|uniref:Guanylate cyclase n=1 Tax=Tribolium castaneum TaxID=7070 RepID=D6X177_TRICA|nr:PREDICTED: guanylate cyclase 32E [Tribolium castaneum]EFA10586.2 Guanylate cyclase 32E-like Protein [Tribolium castaneum]|eukprot:XP_008198489.1 PREDICTED: guanylate cyclase 32E [Tribolium castaneum]
MRLGLASLLVALLLFSPSRSTSPLPPFEEDANARFLALHAAPSRPSSSSTTSSTHHHHQNAPPPFKKYTSSEEDIQHNDLDMGHRDEEAFRYTSASAYSVVDRRENLTSENLKSQPLHKRKQITVGYLTAVKGELRERQGLAVSGAISMALNEVNNDPDILPNVTLVMRWNDTRGDTVIATRAMTDMVCDGVSAFFGPEGTCHVEAIVAQSRNIPMISYKCSDYKASQVPTFARTEPPDTQVTKSVVSLLDYYKWYKFSIIYEEAWYTVAQSLVQEAKKKNMTINDEKKAKDSYKCCAEQLTCCGSGYWYQFIQNTKNRTRIYVFLGGLTSLLDLMITMQTAQLFENGEYIVIYVDTNTYSEKEAHKYIWKPAIFDKYESCISNDYNGLLKRGKSLFVVVPTAPTENYESFTEKVRYYNSREPFNFETSVLLKSFEKYVSIYAAYLYDSFKLYANALHKLLSEEPALTDELIEEIASNGTKIVETIIQMKTYKSITGATMKLDKNGDSEGNFSVLAFQPVSGDQHVHGNFSCPFQMRPVGQFFQQSGDFPEYKIYTNTQIQWAGSDKPNDEPSCGFNNELCPKPNTHLNSIIAAGVLAILLFCAGVITMSIYRKWKIEQEIEGLLWKIDRSEIHSYFERDIVSSPSRLSLISASVTSYESRGGLQVFATTAQYRGVVVRIKELTFSRKKDISRDVMKEMRLLRELRHDNINSFIGACVEPTSLLLVTDYCAKGSLYDIIENEDIKLDKMFIASLVHDLIKGMLYIHNSMLVCHGNLKSSNCVVTSRWVLQVTDFGLAEMRHCAENDSIGEHQYYRSLFWKAPEILRNPSAYCRGTQKGDVYAFAIILYEILGRKGPFGMTGFEPKEIIELVKREPIDGEESFRPDIDLLLDCEIGCDDYVLQCMKDCWAENPEARPDFAAIRSRLKRMKDGKNKNIMDQMMDMMVTYANNLEEIVTERTRLLYEEKMKTEDLLHRMLPKPVAERLTNGSGVEPESFDSVTIYFSDIVGFTAMSAESTPLQVVNFLNDLYTVFDRIIKGYDVYKVETIGDAYMVVSGLPLRNKDRHAGEIASMALDLLSAVKNHSISHRPKEVLKLRIGIHTGPVVAGVVGLTMPRYCLFGDTVNTASRMESNGEPLKIHISHQCKEVLDKLGGYIIEERGLVNMKGKGEVRTFWLIGATDQAIQRREVDLGDIPPLFCRPRRSPKLNNDSRQASVCGGFGGMTSRRHSSVPRGASIEVESTSTLPSPLPTRLKITSRHLNVPDQGSKLTINTAFGSQIIENPEELRRGLRPRRVLSSIASSSDEQKKSQNMLNKIRESRSLDPLPLVRPKPVEGKPLDVGKRSTRSLENCDKCGEVQIIAIPEDKLFNNNFPNGNILPTDESYIEDVQVPLLNTQCPVVRRRGGSAIDDTLQNHTSKRWRSLESLPASCDPVPDIQSKKKASLKSWLVGLFNGNGLKSSNTSLRKGVINDYNNLTEKESIV